MRPINNGTTTAERIILNKQVEAAKAAAYSKGSRLPPPRYSAMRFQHRAKDQMDEEPESNPSFLDSDGGDYDGIHGDDTIMDDQADIPEAFLTVLPGSTSATNIGKDKPRALLDVLQCVSKPNDMYFTKSHYSALRSGELIQTLRMQLITELYICGALSNTSVYATAMDAASHGFQITLVEDCLGYRDRKRHDHALSLLDEETGCDILTKDDLIHKIEGKNHGQSTSRRPVRDQESDELTSMLGMLKLRSEASTKSRSDANDTKGELNNLSARPSGAGTNLVVDDDSSAVPPAIRTTVINGKTRVKSKILQRSNFEKEKTLEKTKPKTKEIDILASLMAKLDTHKEPTAEQKTPSVVEHPTAGAKTERDESEEGKSDLPVAKRIESIAEDKQTAEISTGRAISAISDDMPPSTATATAAAQEMPRWKEGELLCEGDTVVITTLLPPDQAEIIFDNLKIEVQWQRMSHQGGEVPRLVAVQGEIGPDGSIPIYRHPADESPPLLAFSPAVSLIRREVEKAAGHEINHCLIQLYRDGKDYISEHSDKTLDIVPNTNICNVSLGAERTMVFRGKRGPTIKDNDSSPGEVTPRNTVRANLPHNSMMRMGLKTNMKWMHSIRQDKRRDEEKTDAEQDFCGCRISLTFRLIGTFLSKKQSMIWGQGATAKDKENARRVVNGPTEEAKKMVEAFSAENRSPEFDWKAVYGKGFDVLHMSNERRLLLSGNSFVDDGVLAAIAHLRLTVKWTPNPLITDLDTPNQHLVKLVDTDIGRSTVEGYAAVLLYLDAVYGKRTTPRTPFEYARLYTRLMLAISLTADKDKKVDLDVWEAFAAEGVYMAGSEVSVVDFALFPLVHGVLQQTPMDALPKLRAYDQRLLEIAEVKKVLATIEAHEPAA